jgi:hypothetical protein
MKKGNFVIAQAPVVQGPAPPTEVEKLAAGLAQVHKDLSEQIVDLAKRIERVEQILVTAIAGRGFK